MGVPAVTLPCPCGQSVQPFDPFFEQVGSCQHPLLGLPVFSKFAVIGVIISQSSLQDLLLVVGSLFSISFWYGSTPLHWRHSFMEDKMSQANSCTCSGLQGGPGSLFSWYTSLYSPLISPREVLYPTSWMVGTSTFGSSLGVPCWHLSKLLTPFLSVPTLQHAGTFCGG